MEVGATAAVAAAGGAGMGLFSYNRGNYTMDAKNRYTRYTAGLNMAIAQTGMYRQDIADLTSLTVQRQDVYHSIAAMGLTILTAIYCPGRLGLHTPPPPGWLMGLAFVNIAGCYMFMMLTIWLCIHAQLRADTASTHMLTRFVRLPIPSQGMLDKARRFLSSYEEQPINEIFRIPFTQHSSSKDEGKYNEDMDIDEDAQRRARRGTDVPAWYRMEKTIGKTNVIDSVESMMPLAGRGNAPEHFEAYREIQHEWFPYDVYARLSIFLAFQHLLHCWAYMQIGHQLQETRALWACAIVLLPMFVLQQIILTLDIIPKGLPIHRLGPCALWFAYIAAVIEYKRWFTEDAMQLGFVLVYIAYAIHIINTIQLIRICAPSKSPPSVAETPGASWWPSEWRLPTQFQHAIWLVAPPKELEPGLTDIAGELRAAQGRDDSPSGEPVSPTMSERRSDVHRALGKQGESAAWFNVRMGLYAMLLAWVFMTFGFTIEVMNQGTAHPSLLSAPGMPNNARDPRYRRPKVGYSEPTEVGTGGVRHGPARGVHADAVHRRLSALAMTPDSTTQIDQNDILTALHSLMPHLNEIARTGKYFEGGFQPAVVAPAPVESTSSVHSSVQWPAFFEPQFLSCGADATSALTLSRYGRGAVFSMPEGSDDHVSPMHFTLDGVAPHGPLVASSWHKDGLLLVASSGATLECPGRHPTTSTGRWQCSPLLGAKLPISLEGKPLTNKVAIARVGAKGLRAAVLFPGDDSVTIFARADRDAAPWLPAGEVSVSTDAGSPSFVAGAEALLLTALDGAVTQIHMGTGRMQSVVPAVPGLDQHEWPAACQLPSGRFARLALGAETAAKLVIG